MLAINTLPTCTGASSSFISYGDLQESLIDHILLPAERLDTVLSCEILEDHVLNVSRHLPVACSVRIPAANLNVNNFEFPSHIKWDKLTEESKQSYKSDLETLLIKDSNVEGQTCHESLSKKYMHIVDCITRSSESLPKTKFKPFLKPYWDSVLKNLHAIMHEKRRIWKREGQPRGKQHLAYKQYKAAKAIFRAHHRKCAENYLMELNIEIDKAAKVDSSVFLEKS